MTYLGMIIVVGLFALSLPALFKLYSSSYRREYRAALRRRRPAARRAPRRKG